MGYIKSRANGTVQGMYCDICGKEYVRVLPNPNDLSQDMCVKCYNDFYNGGQQKDQQIAELKAENLSLQEQSIRDNQNYNEELANLQQQLKDNTKQVCEKIRKELYYCCKTYLEDEPYIEICIVKGILDQIEKGNKDGQ